MPDKFSWTANFGRWGRVELQLHLAFLLFAAFVFGIEWHYLSAAGTSFGTGIATVSIFLLVAILHELAHGFAATSLGGQIRSLVVTPWGGKSDIMFPPNPQEQLMVNLAGPFLNAVFFLLGALILIVAGQASFLQLIDPLSPFAVETGLIEISLMKIFTWVNFQMLAVNLLPFWPFDGSRIVRSSVLSWNSRTPALNLENAILGAGIAAGLLMFLFAWLVRDYNSGPVQPTWLLLTLAGILAIFLSRYGYHLQVIEARQSLEMLDDYMNYQMIEDDFDSADAWLADFESDAIAGWINDQQSTTEEFEKSVAVDEERRVDLILEKLHQTGIESLSEEEREFLNRISQQYRRRRELKS